MPMGYSMHNQRAFTRCSTGRGAGPLYYYLPLRSYFVGRLRIALEAAPLAHWATSVSLERPTLRSFEKVDISTPALHSQPFLTLPTLCSPWT